ncbi:MAG: hypothetical protein QME51_01360 [Planctomycetota bacterium]|nr:hypothetical protein [Planctomycetota bacterium]
MIIPYSYLTSSCLMAFLPLFLTDYIKWSALISIPSNDGKFALIIKILYDI